MTKEPLIATVNPCENPEWAELAATGDVFHSPPWIRVLRDAFGVEPHAHLITEPDSHKLAGLPVCRIDDIVGERLSTMPFSDFAGPLGVDDDDDAEWSALLTRVLDDGLPFKLRTLHHSRFDRDERLEAVGRAKWHSVDLTADIETTWDTISSAARQAVRRARRSGVEVSISSDRAALAEFEELHLALRRQKYGMLSQPPEFFDAIVAHFAADFAVVKADLEGQAVAAIVLLRWGNKAYYKFNASRIEALSSRANDLVMWEAITFAGKTWGCESLDLGLSDLDQPGLIRYKEKYASNSNDVVTYRSVTPDESSLSQEARTLTARIAATVAREGTPEAVCADVSSSIYRYFC